MIDIVLDGSGAVDSIVIGVPVAPGGAEKPVAVPMSDMRTDSNNRHSVVRTQAELAQASAYRLDKQGGQSGTTSSGSSGAGSSGAGK